MIFIKLLCSKENKVNKPICKLAQAGIVHAHFAKGLHFSAFHLLSNETRLYIPSVCELFVQFSLSECLATQWKVLSESCKSDQLIVMLIKANQS